MNLILIAFAPEAISILAPRSYHGAIWVIPPVAASVFFMFLYNLFGNVEFYFEENKFIMIASVLGAVLNIILNYIFVPLCGYIAAGYTTLFCYIVYSLSHYIFMKKVDDDLSGSVVALWVYCGHADRCLYKAKRDQPTDDTFFETGREMKKIITYGTFDLLHYGHINLLKRAKALGDYLIVALSTDAFNWDSKQKKCYFGYEERKKLLEAIRYVFAMWIW